MSIALATKGKICPTRSTTVQANPFTAILSFNVTLILATPSGFQVTNTDPPPAKPSGFRVEDV